MIAHRRGWLAGATVLGWIASSLLLTGCFNPFSPRVSGSGISSPPPTPNSPTNILRLLEWAYNHRDASIYREIFTDDYRFEFGEADAYGLPYRENPWTREDELTSTTKLFQGGDAQQPAASNIQLQLDRNFYVQNDTRPGKTARWHKAIHTNVLLNISTGDSGGYDVTGFVWFYVVRGDSALIPQELKDRGFGPDSTRWYIEKWVDETAQGTDGEPASLRPAPLPAPARSIGPAEPANTTTRLFPVAVTWGTVKAIYR